jgi:predicted deacetylase
MSLVISVDDVCPNPRYGTPENIMLLERLAQKHKNLKITLFVVPNMKYNLRFGFARNPYRLDKHKNWCRWINERKCFELAVHGYTHSSKHKFLEAAEFNCLNQKNAENKLLKAEKVLNKSGLHFVKGFRQPGWIAPNYLINLLERRGYIFIAGSMDVKTPISKDAICNDSGYKGLPLIYPKKMGRIVHIPSNIGLDWLNLQRAREIMKLNGIVSVKAHISSWDENGITFEKVRALDSFIQVLKDEGIKLTSMTEIARIYLE